MLVALTACAAPLTLDEIKSRPEAHLYFPGSAVERASGQPQANGAFDAGPQDGFWVTYLTASADRSAIVSWYKNELASRSWIFRGSDQTGRFAEVDAETGSPLVWTRGNKESFHLIFRPELPQEYEIVYTVFYGGCVSVSPYLYGDGSCADGKLVTPIP